MFLTLAALLSSAHALIYQSPSKLPARYQWESPQTTVQLWITPALLPGGVYATLTPQDFIAPPQHWVGGLAHEGGKYNTDSEKFRTLRNFSERAGPGGAVLPKTRTRVGKTYGFSDMEYTERSLRSVRNKAETV